MILVKVTFESTIKHLAQKKRTITTQFIKLRELV